MLFSNKKNILFFFLFFYVQNIFGQILPSSAAGVVDRQIEEQYDARQISLEKEIPLLEIDIPSKKLEIPDDEKVYIEKVIFEGNCEFDDKTLQKIINGRLNKEFSMSEILDLCTKIKCFYVQKGYFLARAYCPVQEIENGILKITILEGNLGKINVINNKKHKASFISSYFERFISKPINYNKLMEALLLVNENLNLEVGTIFKKGKDFGTVDLILQVEDKTPFTFYVDQNNYGSLFTTKWRTGSKIEVGNVITNGDVLSTTQVFGNPFSNLYFSLYDYKVPVTRRGTILDLSYLFSKFTVNQLKELQLKGRSDIFSIGVTQAIYRTKLLNMDFYSSFDIKQIQNFSLGDTTSYDKLRTLQLGLYLDYIDNFIDRSPGRSYLDFNTSIGIPSFLDGSKAVDPKSSRPGSGGRFVIFRLDALRLQETFKDNFLFFHFNGQITPYKLPLPEQIYIGGMPSVRGYRLAYALGDDGYYFNLEYRLPPPFIARKQIPMLKKDLKDFIQILGFLDQGQVFLKGQATDTQQESILLRSVGFGLRIFGPWKINFALDVGYPLREKESAKTETYLKISWQIL